jgi:hypothetical protein
MQSESGGFYRNNTSIENIAIKEATWESAYRFNFQHRQRYADVNIGLIL